MEKEYTQWVYYDDEDGKIIGLVYKIGNGAATIWGAKVYTTENVDGILGQYIDSDYARRAVENYWLIKDRTLLAGPPP